MTDRMVASRLMTAAKEMREDAIHASIVAYLREVLPLCIVHHSPNGGLRAKREGAKLRRMGTLAGWPDIEIVGRDVHAFMEVKVPGGSLSPEQRALRDFFKAIGTHWALVRSIEDARVALASWGLATRETETNGEAAARLLAGMKSKRKVAA